MELRGFEPEASDDGRVVEFCGYLARSTVTGAEFEIRVRGSFFTE